MNFTPAYLSTLPAFLTWFGLAALVLLAAVKLYTLITPWREIALIRAGNAAAAISLSGTTVGYALVLSSVIKSSVSRTDMLLWSVIGLAVQFLAVLVARLVLGKGMRERMERGDLASGIVLAGLSVAFGLLNAAVMVPDPSGDIARILDHITRLDAN